MYGCCLLITSPDNKVSKSLKTNLLPTNVENTKKGKPFCVVKLFVIHLIASNGDIFGTDSLIKKKNTSNDANYSIRFHIYPGINAVQTVSGKSILLQISKNKSWIFLSEDQDLQIEKGLFLGRNKVLNNHCIVIYGNTKNQNTDIKWELRKSN